MVSKSFRCLMITFIFALYLSLTLAVGGGFLVGVKHGGSSVSLMQIGSTPPRCDGSRCRSCGHCQAIQVPTTTRRQDYSDYKPMRWKCKCGSSIFNP